MDGGSGHSGKRSFDVFFGLGDSSGPVTAAVSWRDTSGQTHSQELELTAGWHEVSLGTSARVVNGR